VGLCQQLFVRIITNIIADEAALSFTIGLTPGRKTRTKAAAKNGHGQNPGEGFLLTPARRASKLCSPRSTAAQYNMNRGSYGKSV
jgi:hypothetical protein